MIPGLADASLIATGALAVVGLLLTVFGRSPGRELRIATWVVVAVLVVQAVIAALRVLGGVELPDQTTFLIYLLVSVCVLPIAAQFASAEPNRWSGAVVAVGAIATFVVVLRLQALWVVASG